MKTVRAMNVNFMTGKKGNLYDIVGIPEDVLEECKAQHAEEGLTGAELEKAARMDALNEWVAMNTVEFYNEVQLIYSLSATYHEDNFKGANLGFPPGFNYRFPGKEVLNGAEYVQSVMSWISDQMESPAVFPESDDDPFPANFLDEHMSKVYTRMCRIFAIMLTKCYDAYIDIDAVAALNFCWKHFFYFVSRYDLVPEKEFAAVKKLSGMKGYTKFDDLRASFKADKAKSSSK